MAEVRVAGAKMRWFAGAVFALAAMPTSVAKGDAMSSSLRTPLEAHRQETSNDGYLFSEWHRGAQPGAGVIVTDDLLAERIDYLQQASPAFRRTWSFLRTSGIPILVGTSEQLTPMIATDLEENPDWAGVTLTWNEGPGGALDRAAVVVRVQHLRELHEAYGTPLQSFMDTLDDVLVRELYGNLLPTVERWGAPLPEPDNRDQG